MKEIYFIRHGQTEWNKKGLGQGQEADIPLNDEGREQVRKSALYLRKYRITDKNFDCIFASPMKRTKESAEIIKNVIGFKNDIEYLDILKERKQGKLSGLDKSDPLMVKIKEFEKKMLSDDPIDRIINFDKIMEQVNEKFDVGFETNTALEKRLMPFIEMLIKSKCKKILVVGHGGALLSLMRTLFKIIRVPEGNFDNGSNCWISYIVFKNNEFKLLSPPNTEHLGLKLDSESTQNRFGSNNREYEKTIQNPKNTPWLDWIEAGIKTYEGRLNVGFWNKVKINDVIIFTDNRKKVKTKVVDLKYYNSFELAYDDLKDKLVPIKNITRHEVKKLYNQYFSDDKIKQFGVIAVGVKII